jgi:ABC-type lipoprotein export system ATPase subunit
MRLLIKANNKGKIVYENQLMNSIENKEKERSVVIISGVAGSGKSTILSHFYFLVYQLNVIDDKNSKPKN